MSKTDKWIESIRQLMNSYDTLSSFQEGQSWIEEAEKQIQEAKDIRNRLLLETSRIKENIAEAENIRQNKSFLKRNLGSRKEENDLKKNYQEGVEEINSLDQLFRLAKVNIQ
jgi:predicted nuclease with TOPRIM domain